MFATLFPNPVKNTLLLLALSLGLLACKKDSDENKPAADPNRARRMVVTWTLEGTAPVHLKIERFSSANSSTVVATPVNEDKATSGSWEYTGSPNSFGGRATFSYAGTLTAGNRCHIVVTQDGQVLPGRDIWVGHGVPNGSGGTHNLRGAVVTISPDANR